MGQLAALNNLLSSESSDTLKELVMGEQKEPGMGWLERRRERKRLKRERTGDSPEKLEQHHTPKRDSMDMYFPGRVDRDSRFENRFKQ